MARVVIPHTGKGEVSRGNVALMIAACLTDDSTMRRTLEFKGGQAPIPEARQRDWRVTSITQLVCRHRPNVAAPTSSAKRFSVER